MEGEKFQNEGITNLHNLPGHQEVKLQGRKKPVSTAQIMDERPHADIPLKPPLAATGVE